MIFCALIFRVDQDSEDYEHDECQAAADNQPPTYRRRDHLPKNDNGENILRRLCRVLGDELALLFAQPHTC